MSTRRCHAVALVVGVTLTLGSCGGDDGAAERSPLEAIWGSPMSPAEERAQQLAIEEATAQCMKDEGWEYEPVDWSARTPTMVDDDPSDPAYGERYGYGIVRSYELYELPFLDENGEPAENDDSFEDPNQRYIEALTDAERDEYYAALYGDQSDQEMEIDPDTGEEIWVQPPPEQRGCSGMAAYEVQGPQPWDDPDFSNRLDELLQPLENDPRINDAEVLWSDCMYERDEEYDFYGPDDVYEFVSDFLNEAKGLRRVAVDPESGEVVGGDGEVAEGGWMSDEDGNAWGYIGTPKVLSTAQLERLTAREVALWQADQKCQESSGLRQLRQQVERDLAETIREEFPDLVKEDR